MLKLSVDTRQIMKLSNLYKAVGAQAPLAMIRAVNHTGDKARTQMRKVLVPQTGLKRKTINKAVKSKRAFGPGAYTIYSKGGNIRLMFFGPRETRLGVTAAPWNKRQLYPGAFTKGGRFPGQHAKTGGKTGGRVDLNMGGAVFQRAGRSRLPLKGVKSGLFIAEEMVKDASQNAFYSTVERELPKRIAHELYRIIG